MMGMRCQVGAFFGEGVPSYKLLAQGYISVPFPPPTLHLDGIHRNVHISQVYTQTYRHLFSFFLEYTTALN